MKKYLLFVLSLSVVLALNIYFRSFPIYFPQLKISANEMMQEQVRQRAIQDIATRFSQFNPLAKEKLLKSRIAEYYRQSGKEISREKHALYLKLKDRFQDDLGQTYLMELDCWHWARYVDNVVHLGRPGDEVVYDKQWDLMMLAPSGRFMAWDQFLFYSSAFLYKLFILVKQVPLLTFLFYLPLLYAAIFVVILYFFTYRCGGHIAAILACLSAGLASVCIQRSSAGWFDKDILCLIFPLLITWTYLLSLEAVPFKRKMVFCCLASFFIGLFCFTWENWWFIFLIILGYEFLSLCGLFLAYSYRRKNEFLVVFKKRSIFFGLFLFQAITWILLICGLEPLVELWKVLSGIFALNAPLKSSIWPNVYYTVGELRRANLRELASQVHGFEVFVLSVISLLFLLVLAFRKWKYASFKRECACCIALWFLAMYFACSKGIRFAFFLIVPMGVSVGWMTKELYLFFKNTHRIIAVGITALLCLSLSITFIHNGYAISKNIYPLMNDNWYALLKAIKEKTPKDTIVNSWWDFGDWFKAVANRRVIFDGQSQNTPQAYWMAKALLSNNEEEAVRILRMLNNGGNRAFDVIEEYVKNPLKSVLLLESIIALDAEKAKQSLLDFLPLSAVQEVLKLLYETPPRAAFIVDPSMPSKIVAISYLGNWNFSKVYIAQNFHKEEKGQILDRLAQLGRPLQETQLLYQEVFLISPGRLDDWISQRTQFYTGVINGREKDGNIFFEPGFVYNPKEQTFFSESGQVPLSLFVLVNDKLLEYTYPNPTAGFSAFVFKASEGYKAMLLDRQLVNSLFVRLYFFNASGLKHFTPIIDAQEGTEHIRVFKINW